MSPDDFKKLQAKWYAKLKRSGFDDAENTNHELKKFSNVFTTMRANTRLENAYTKVSRESKAEYYRLAEHFLNDHVFKKNQKIIWEYHANGLSVREITVILNKVRRKKTNRHAIWEIVRDLREEMFNLYGVKT